MLPAPRRVFSLLLLSLSLNLLLGCSPTRLLQPGQNLLYRVRLEGVKEASTDRLQALYQQKPNTRFPLPKLAIYQLGQSFYNPERLRRQLEEERTKYDSLIRLAGRDSVTVGQLLLKREKHTQRHQLALTKGNALMRIGEAPVVYDSLLTARTAEQMAVFLRSQGFFRSQVRATEKSTDRRVSVTYSVTENQPFRYAQLDYHIGDTAVAAVVLAGSSTSLLHLGDRYNEEAIGLERSRLETLLKNAGYYDFRQQYVTLEADTSFAPGTVRLRTIVANPGPGERHKVYTVRRVNVFTDAGTTRFGVKRDTVRRDSVNFLAYRQRYSSKVLNQRVEVRPGSRYSLLNTQTTQRQLADLDMFRFNTVTYQKVQGDSASGLARLDANIYASPLKKFQETTELGATYSALLVGPFANIRVKTRNLFGGAEVLETSLRAGLEGQYRQVPNPTSNSPKGVYSFQLGGNVSLILPQFLVPWQTNRFLTRYNPKTRVSTSYTYVKRPDYTRTNLEGSYDYIWQRSAYQQYVVTPLNISLLNTSKIDPDFKAYLGTLANNGAILRSFGRQLVPSASATSLYNSNDFNQTRNAAYFRVVAELGGLGRQLYTQPDPASGDPRLAGIPVLDYARFNADYRRYYKLTPLTYLAWRLNTGVAHALTRTTFTADGVTSSSFVIPYDKYFFAGGGSSLRAWRPRRLGPGSYTTFLTKDGQPQYDSRGKLIQDENVEQPAELLLEGSVEYRFPIYDYIYGAFFTDFGNVWSLRPDDPREGANFSANRFYQEIAVGSGLGIRFDLTFLIIRLDIATKVYDPTAVPGDKWAIRRFAVWRNDAKPWLNTPTLNVGIGYPF
ncbi:BamA/TamA family outer membrane protein [Hymenobacter lutimineralis]|uniref:BamA/TamA family outer membrane protein n=1 Tax=Hymenobacter lutimineralis TaxID=2606448 RepID=A0A5D6UZY8_9BACT|nr:BamA/TamA family outer membrane protein [Hymenobacter lutimineralis]TYZ08388.1 BamA/TamA family outer membrane protein [Hymenobacter lutimineralis]